MTFEGIEHELNSHLNKWIVFKPNTLYPILAAFRMNWKIDKMAFTKLPALDKTNSKKYKYLYKIITGNVLLFLGG